MENESELLKHLRKCERLYNLTELANQSNVEYYILKRRIKNDKHPLTPKEENAIRNTLKAHGITID